MRPALLLRLQQIPNDASSNPYGGVQVIDPAFFALLFTASAGGAFPQEAGAEPGCTFETLTEAEQRRYQSRYRRRVRIDGKAFADAWLQEQACPTQARQAAKTKRPVGDDGQPCKRTRMEMRVTPGLDGVMTMTPVTVCAD
jgi:hypothetical protein